MSGQYLRLPDWKDLYRFERQEQKIKQKKIPSVPAVIYLIRQSNSQVLFSVIDSHGVDKIDFRYMS
jgi:hypothetical protein